VLFGIINVHVTGCGAQDDPLLVATVVFGGGVDAVFGRAQDGGTSFDRQAIGTLPTPASNASSKNCCRAAGLSLAFCTSPVTSAIALASDCSRSISRGNWGNSVARGFGSSRTVNISDRLP
jgi:hypothetical protein